MSLCPQRKCLKQRKWYSLISLIFLVILVCFSHGRCLNLLLWVFLQLVSGIRGMVQQRELFLDLLRIADHMKAFVFHRMGGEEELHSRLEQAEANLTAARRASEESVEALRRSQDDNEVLRIELEEAKSRKEATETRLNEAEDGMAQLRGKMRQLRTEVSIQRK